MTDEQKLLKYTEIQIFMKRLLRVRHMVKPGRKLTVWTLKANTLEGGTRSAVRRKATVLATYPQFAHCRIDTKYGGKAREESFMWDDITKWNKQLWEGAE